MSRTLRRPMFRGGRVSAYGTGIASGLADGGRVGYWQDYQGGMVLGSELYPKSNITTLEDLQESYKGGNYAGRNITDLMFEKEVGSEGDVVEVGLKDLDIDTRTDEEKALDADIRSEQTAKEELKESALASMRIKKKKTIGELELEKIRAELEQLRKDGAGSESLDIDKKTYLKLLGGDKARGEDISSMLLGFAGAEGDTVMEKFQKFAATEATRPSKRKSLEEASAMLAIKDYIAGKRSKEQLDVLLGQLDYKSLLSKKNLAEHISESRKTRSGVGAIKDGIQQWRPGVKIEEVTSTEALEFGPEDEGIIFIETDTKDVYTIKDGGKVPLYTS